MKLKKSNGASWWDWFWWQASLLSCFYLDIIFSRFFSGKLTFPHISFKISCMEPVKNPGMNRAIGTDHPGFVLMICISYLRFKIFSAMGARSRSADWSPEPKSGLT